MSTPVLIASLARSGFDPAIRHTGANFAANHAPHPAAAKSRRRVNGDRPVGSSPASSRMQVRVQHEQEARSRMLYHCRGGSFDGALRVIARRSDGRALRKFHACDRKAYEARGFDLKLPVIGKRRVSQYFALRLRR
jgi:hypothetical protein